MITNEENGAVTLMEAIYVFPIMFLIILFLIYMGNMFYMRSRVDGIVTQYAVKAAAYSVDPFLEELENSNSLPTQISNVKPYHSILGGSDVSKVRNEMDEALDRLGTGFFAGMGLRHKTVNKFKKESTLITNTFTADVTYKIQFPMRLFGQKEPIALTTNSLSVIALTDTPEFILDVDMVIDFLETKGVDKKLAEIESKIGKFLK